MIEVAVDKKINMTRKKIISKKRIKNIKIEVRNQNNKISYCQIK